MDVHGHPDRTPQPPEGLLFDLALQAYAGSAHVPGEGGHDRCFRWVACHRCLDVVDELCIEAIKRGLREDGRAGAPLAQGVAQGISWLRVAGPGYILRALASVEQTLRANEGRLANPGATAYINKAYQEAFAQAVGMRCSSDEAQAILAAILEQVHRGWRIPEGQLVDWEKAGAFVASRTSLPDPLDTDRLRSWWEDDVRPAIARHPKAAAQLDRHLYRMPDVRTSIGDDDAVAGAAPVESEGADLFATTAVLLLRAWSDDPRHRQQRARAIVEALVEDQLGSTADVDPALIDQAAASALVQAEDLVARARWLAAVRLAVGPRIDSRLLVRSASRALETTACELLSAAPDGVERSARTLAWRGWVDAVIVDACELHDDLHHVRDAFRAQGVASIEPSQARLALVAALARRHGWS
ncbi:MAG TPA: hypothetical protein VK507_10915, partial [Iamia sp.]|nr:hypothetical protein [Iamia sp.]